MWCDGWPSAHKMTHKCKPFPSNPKKDDADKMHPSNFSKLGKTEERERGGGERRGERAGGRKGGRGMREREAGGEKGGQRWGRGGEGEGGREGGDE